MTARKPSKPWRIVLTTPGEPITQPYGSERATYEAVRAEKERIAAGTSRVTRIRVEHWENGRWIYYDRPWPEQ